MTTIVDTPTVSLSVLDEERFGVKTAKCRNLSLHDIPGVLDFCRSNEVKFLMARCPTKDLAVVHRLEQEEFLLMDTLITFARNIVERPIPKADPQIVVREVSPGDENIVRSMALECYRGYLGHYHADYRLEKAKCDEVYEDWAYRSCLSRDPADSVLVAQSDGEIAGFGTMRVNGPQETEGLLFGVSPAFRGMGIYRSIMIHCMMRGASQGIEKMIIATQVTNLISQKVWVRLGFEPVCSNYTFHRWFD